MWITIESPPDAQYEAFQKTIQDESGLALDTPDWDELGSEVKQACTAAGQAAIRMRVNGRPNSLTAKGLNAVNSCRLGLLIGSLAGQLFRSGETTQSK